MTNPPKLIAERYQVGPLAGAGGMAQVYRGTDTVLNRTVAVKVLGPQYAQDAGFVERFRREAQAAARLNHPNVVSVFDTGSDGPVHYIVMEYVAGRTLADVLKTEGHLMPERAAEIAAQVASALSFAHAAGIVHRDVKPGNIMITPQGEVKVMDFGIARAASTEPLTQTATVLGTASYLSPEQAEGRPVDARSDIYSLGIVLYEELTGVPPFQADSPVAVAYKHVRENPVLPSQVVPGIPPDLEAVVLKAMAKNPANRYASAAEMREDLERFLSGRPVEAAPVLLGDGATGPMEPTAVESATAAAALTAQPTTVASGDEPPSGGRSRWLIGLAAGLIIGILVLALTAGRSVPSGGPGPADTPTVNGHVSPTGDSSGPGHGGQSGGGASGPSGSSGQDSPSPTATTAPTTAPTTGATTAPTTAPPTTAPAPAGTTAPPPTTGSGGAASSPDSIPGTSAPQDDGGSTPVATSGPGAGSTSGA